MSERLDELVKIISDLMADTAVRKDSEGFLEIAIASRLLFRAIPGAEKQSWSALYSIENALSLLIETNPPPQVSETELAEFACSFCGKKRPEVQLGAGAEAFICNECVDLFKEVFRMEKEKGGSPNKQV